MQYDKKYQPLVSVGIPTCNRPDSLRRTLECVTGQTYTNLEIIVSDNCSSCPETEIVVREFMVKDDRIRYFKQEWNKGPLNNFKFVLETATGEYFIWAADDDVLVENFIEQCVSELNKKGTDYVAAVMEAQYFDEKQRFEYFSEGGMFYNFASNDKMERLHFMLKYNYGNLYYSLFRKDALFDSGKSYFECVNVKSLNEISLFLFVAQNGNWLVIPRIGIYKRTSLETYEQARWEIEGGRLPNAAGLSHYKKMPYIFKYHLSALNSVLSAINRLRMGAMGKIKLKLLSLYYLVRHFCFFIVRRKRRVS
ncbi:MAG: glycosyltransferase family 2 protein [Thermoplasmata archaeon]